MKTITTVTQPATSFNVESFTCDLCGKPCGDDRGDAVRIERRIQREYTEDEAMLVDCCAACFAAKVLPALVALGFTPREES